jgi:hypothetical protein
VIYPRMFAHLRAPAWRPRWLAHLGAHPSVRCLRFEAMAHGPGATGGPAIAQVPQRRSPPGTVRRASTTRQPGGGSRMTSSLADCAADTY